MKRNTRYVLILSAVAAVLGLLVTGPVLGQGKSAPAKSPAAPASNSTDSATAAQAKAWTAFYAGKYEEAAKICAVLLKAQDEKTRLQATHCFARCQWASGQKTAQATARKTFGQLAQEATLPDSKVRADLGKMIIQDAEAHVEGLPQAIAGLEIICRGHPAGTATAEALIELGHLYTRAARYDDAQKSYEQVAELLKDINKLELTPTEAVPFQAEAQRLLDRLRFERDAGREPFEKAYALQVEKKFKEALAGFEGVVKDYPFTEYAGHSKVCAGECLRDTGQTAEAVALWKQFIKASPSGPWRGQAFIDAIDLYLEHSLDLKTAKEQTMEAFEQLRPGLDGEKSAASWKLAARDLYLRIGTIAYLEGRCPGAAEAFKEAAAGGLAVKTPASPATTATAAKAAPPKTSHGLEALIAATEANRPVVPADVGAVDPENRPALALALGRIYFLADLGDRAAALFDRVLAPKTSAALTAPQKAYAQFCQALLLDSASKPDEAKAAYLASIKTCPAGSWTDETLFRLASLVQREAEKQYVEALSKPANSATKSTASPAVSDTGKAALMAARGQALPYWQELVKRYPQSPYVETAAYSVGLLFYEQKQWKNSLAALDDFTKKYPASLFQGEALWLLARINFEQLLEPTEAKSYYEALDAWIKPAREAKPAFPAGWEVVGFVRYEEPRDKAKTTTVDGKEVKRVVLTGAIPVKREPGEKPSSYTAERYFDELESETAKSLGFIAFVDNRKDDAAKNYERTEKLDQKLGWVQDPQYSDCSRLRWGLQHGYLYAYPQELKPYNERERFAVLLADFYYVTQRFADAGKMAQRLLDGDAGRLSDSAQAYPQYLKAASTNWTQNRDEAFKEYMKVVGPPNSFNPDSAPFTAARAAYAAGNIATMQYVVMKTENKKLGRELLRRLALSNRDDEYGNRAKITYAVLLVREGQREEGERLLRSFPDSAGDYKKIADYYLAMFAKSAQNQPKGANSTVKGDSK